MGYKKVYYEEIWNINNKSSIACNQWCAQLDSIGKTLKTICDSDVIKGEAADSINLYLQDVHSNIIALLMQVLAAFSCRLNAYYYNYQQQVDPGDGSNNARYTTIHSQEIKTDGVVENNVKKIIRTANDAVIDAINVKRKISSLVRLSLPESGNELTAQLVNAIRKASELDMKTDSYENSHRNDLDNINKLISEIKKLIQLQLSKKRVAVASYMPGIAASICDIDILKHESEACKEIINSFQQSGYAEEAVKLAVNRDSLIYEEEVAGRQWMNGVRIGAHVIVAVAGIAATVATGGAASPAAAAAIGALSGAVGGAVNTTVDHVVDSYIATGDGLKGIDTSDFLRDYEISVITGAGFGAIGGKASFAEKNAVIKMLPGDKAFDQMITSGTKGGIENSLKTVWNTGRAMCEGKSGDTVLGIFNSGMEDSFNSILIDAFGGYAEGYFSEYKSLLKSQNVKLSKIGALKLEVQKGAVSKSMREITGLTLNTFETVTSGKPLQNTLGNLDNKINNALKTIVVSSFSEGATAYIKADIEADVQEKGVIRSTIDQFTIDGVETVTEHGASAGWRIVSCVVDPNSSENCIYILTDEAGQWLEAWGKKQTQSILSESVNHIIEFSSNKQTVTAGN